MSYFWIAMRNYAVFSGRTNLKGFWIFQLIIFLVVLICWGIPFAYTLQHLPSLQQLSMIANTNGADSSSQISALMSSTQIHIPFLLTLLSNFATLFALATFIPNLAISARRLHDSNHSAALLWLFLVPLLGMIILIVYFSLASTPGDNRYGPNPNDNPTGTVIPK